MTRTCEKKKQNETQYMAGWMAGPTEASQSKCTMHAKLHPLGALGCRLL